MSASEKSGRKRVAVIGGGWAGLAAAVQLIERGCDVTLFEASRRVGGRARHVDWETPSGAILPLDNGQHILIGAYRSTISLMQKLDVPVNEVLQRLPLTLQSTSGFALKASRLPAPLHLLSALLTARGLRLSDRIQAIRLIQTAKKSGWKLATDISVTKWLMLNQQSPELRERLWEPLCLAALNTPPQNASAQVFLNVLRDSVGASRADSDLLLPAKNLSALLPVAALKRIASQSKVRLARRVTALIPSEQGIEIHVADQRTDQRKDQAVETFDAAILAVSAHHVPALLEQAANLQPAFAKLIQQCRDFYWQPISTVYLLYEKSPFKRSQPPILMLQENVAEQQFGQWVFDREQLSGDVGLVAVVISADGPHRQLESAALIEAVTRQLRKQMQITAAPLAAHVLTEKRATFACTPGLSRPHCRTPDPRLMLAGDYVVNDAERAYPATLESAVRSGIEAANQLASKNP